MFMDELRFLLLHWKKIIIGCFFGPLFLYVAWIINGVMEKSSTEYHSLNNRFFASIIEEPVEITYSKSAEYVLSVSILSLFAENITNNTIKNVLDISNAVSALDKANGKSGKFIVPQGASYKGLGFENIYIYGWVKTYKSWFNTIDKREIEVFFIVDNVAISGSLGMSTIDMFTSTKAYYLE